MYVSKKSLKWAGLICFGLSFFQAVIGFFPSLSLYFGAPEKLVENVYALILVSFFVAGILFLFGLYAFSGAGYIRRLPYLKPLLVFISAVFTLRGLLLIPEFLIVTKVWTVQIPVAPRFIIFSIVSCFIAFLFIYGTVRGWHSFSAYPKKISDQNPF